MGIILWLIIGGVIGWLASIIMKRDAQQGIILNIVVGVIGGLLGGWLLTLFGVDVEGGFDPLRQQARGQEVRTQGDSSRARGAESSNRVAQHDVAGTEPGREDHLDRPVEPCREFDRP